MSHRLSVIHKHSYVDGETVKIKVKEQWRWGKLLRRSRTAWDKWDVELQPLPGDNRPAVKRRIPGVAEAQMAPLTKQEREAESAGVELPTLPGEGEEVGHESAEAVVKDLLLELNLGDEGLEHWEGGMASHEPRTPFRPLDPRRSLFVVNLHRTDHTTSHPRASFDSYLRG